ncbi:zinc ABC transporter substrate-binding protein ZnuA [Lonsdalea populi]|uniref:zinc ABC transporter substrate-binding protein ZnuA n=1 Tax=Lonsdalea populi TaxID=1172565 RepID=UPI000A241240|nr:zinc ABC transporter substrate-binding protein ZnuA [Lonsdalea populi]OSM96083.1 zinc ABC transporter substrate-binding protein [Lonsdalea populi]RAT68285.1 zinc ABC transporter substrate-binding protein [Lonsdalea populi]RAT71888.1 zinc ABC transporter substrate-binding protein [Lonsdalea populi]RAT76337.1 zinc ABC transporter substrate-binding protein [Lonsdalea populi]RAT80017.1 zinc ABC transporter substrate-binding protein [Lonsdalea populi]
MTRRNLHQWIKKALTASTLLVAAGAAPVASADVVTSIRPLAFIAAAIADGVTPTEVLLPDGASPHDYALRPSDVQRLQSSELVIWVGPEMEAFLQKPLSQIPASRQITLSALPAIKAAMLKESHHHSESDHDGDSHHADHGEHAHAAEVHDEHDEDHAHGAAEAEEEHDDGHHHGEFNMHIWLSPEMAQASAIAIHDKLLELMPQNKDKLDANLTHFTEKLAHTDKNIVNMLSPVRNKGYFVFHDAYGYFEQHYGLSPLGYFTINPAISPGAQRLHQIRTQLVEHKAECVFAEPQFRPAVISAVAKGTQVRMGVLDPLGSDIALDKDSYARFLLQLSNQYLSCLEKKS